MCYIFDIVVSFHRKYCNKRIKKFGLNILILLLKNSGSIRWCPFRAERQQTEDETVMKPGKKIDNL